MAGVGVALAGVVVGLASCGSDGGGDHRGPVVVVTQVASGVIDAAGGSVSVPLASASPLAGTQVDIPAGALASSTDITISQVTGDTGFAADVLVTELGPVGTAFAVPASVGVKYDPDYLAANGITDTSTLKVVLMEDGVANQTLMTRAQDDANGLLTADVAQAGRLAVLGYSVASLDGTYRVADFYYESSATQGDMPATGSPLPAPKGFTSDSMIIRFDGAGKFTLSGKQNRDGVTTNVLQVGTYTVDPDGTVAIGLLTGAVLAGGSALVLQSATSGSDPQYIVGIKQGGGSFSRASLNGVYRMANYRFSRSEPQQDAPILGDPLPSPRGMTSEYLTLTFDGAGNYAMTGKQNRDGTLTDVSDAGTYTVNADGVVVFGNMTGALLAGGSGFVLAATSGDPGAAVALKTGAGIFDNASLKGNYATVNYRVAGAQTQGNAPAEGDELPAAKGMTGTLLDMSFDGAGNFSIANGVSNTDGYLTSISFTGVYAIAPDGTLTLGNMTGQVMPGGSVFILSTVSGDPAIVTGLLQ